MDFNQAQFTCSFGLRDQLPPSDTVELVFSGRSNVGKSSLINKLCTRKALARVSSTPGKTTTINFFSLGKDTTLVDLPGYGYAKRSHEERIRWANLMEHYFKSDRNIKLVLLLIDSRHKPSDEDFGMLEFLSETESPFMVVLTKTDKLNKTQYLENMASFIEWLSPYPVIKTVPFSVNGNESAEKLRETIKEYME
ncbi:MAG: ribosome biogenesis GTP-binding protein YihA/YsxC [Oscillospiraceae bacterium]